MPPAPALIADDLLVAGRATPLLPRTSLSVEVGAVALAVGQPGAGHTALALALAGRLRPDSGTVTFGYRGEPEHLQRAVMIVDVPGVSEPEPTVPLHVIIGEELAMAGRPAGRRAVRAFAESQALGEHLDAPMEEVPPLARVTALARLAACRPGSRVLVITYPERHGVAPAAWLRVARQLAQDGHGVLVTASDAVDTGAPITGEHVDVFTIGSEEAR